MSAPSSGTDGQDYRSIWTELLDVSFTQGWLDAGGVSTRYVEAGPASAPAVLMLHGTGGHWETFASNLGPMSKHFRCVAIDMVGNGFSEKPDIDYEIPVYVDHAFATLDALGIERASMIGTSLGSWVAARSSLTCPGPRREAGVDVAGRAGGHREQHAADPGGTDRPRSTTRRGRPSRRSSTT